MSDALYNDAPDGWSGDKGYRAFEIPSDRLADLDDLADHIAIMLMKLHLNNERIIKSDSAWSLAGTTRNGVEVKITVEVR